MRTKIKIEGECPACGSKKLFFGRVLYSGWACDCDNLWCENCFDTVDFEMVNHRRIRVKPHKEEMED